MAPEQGRTRAERILEVLDANPDGVSRSQLARDTNSKDYPTRRLVDRMVNQELVFIIEVDRPYGKTSLVFRNTPDARERAQQAA